MAKRQTPYAFFKAHAGYSIAPGETTAQGQRRSARTLAAAERKACDLGATFEWQEDDQPFECHCEDPTCESREPHTAYGCVARTADGKVYASLWGISFGPGVEPWGEPYRRVVEAELACELEA